MTNIQAIDDLLIERSQGGDRGAFDQLLRIYQDRAYKYAMRLTRDSDAANDVVAEVIIRMYRAISGFKGESSFSTWMYRVTRNCFLDIRKKQKGASVIPELALHADDGDLLATIKSRDLSPYDVAAQNEQMESLRALLDRLPVWHRRILIMFHMDSKTYEEISAILKVPMGTVKSRLNRARIRLNQLRAEHAMQAQAEYVEVF